MSEYQARWSIVHEDGRVYARNAETGAKHLLPSVREPEPRPAGLTSGLALGREPPQMEQKVVTLYGSLDGSTCREDEDKLNAALADGYLVSHTVGKDGCVVVLSREKTS